MLRFIFYSLLILLLLGLFAYQQNYFKRIYSSLKKEILDEWRRQKETEEKIKEEVEAKKKTQEFLIQLDYEKKLINSLEQEIADLKEQVQNRLEELKTYFLNEIGIQKKNLKDYQEKALSSEKELKELFQNLTSQSEYLKEKVSWLDKKISSLQRELRLYKLVQKEEDQKIRDILFRLKQLEEKTFYEEPQELKNATE